MEPAGRWSSGPLLLLGLAIFNHVAGNGNTTAEDEAKRQLCAYPHGNNTDGTTGSRRGGHGHFSKCPEEYKHYCVKGKCRYVVEEKTPACVYVEPVEKMCHLPRATFCRDRCEKGYTGTRCERVDLFYLRGDQTQIVVVSLVAVMVMLIILVVCICTGTHYCRKRRRKRKEEEMGTIDKRLPLKTEDILETNIA